MKNKPYLIFDLDDTLYDIQIQYARLIDKIVDNYYSFLCEQNLNTIPKYYIYDLFSKFNKKYILEYGYGKISFITAIIDTYDKLDNIFNVNSYEIKKEDLIVKIYEDILLDFQTINYYDIFQELYKYYKIFIVTAGDDIQFKKIKKLKISKFVDGIFPFSMKNRLNWEKVIKQIPEESKIIVVGDSIEYDCLPIDEHITEFYYMKHYLPYNIKEYELKHIKCKYTVINSNFQANNENELGIYKLFEVLIKKGINNEYS